MDLWRIPYSEDDSEVNNDDNNDDGGDDDENGNGDEEGDDGNGNGDGSGGNGWPDNFPSDAEHDPNAGANAGYDKPFTPGGGGQFEDFFQNFHIACDHEAPTPKGGTRSFDLQDLVKILRRIVQHDSQLSLVLRSSPMYNVDWGITSSRGPSVTFEFHAPTRVFSIAVFPEGDVETRSILGEGMYSQVDLIAVKSRKETFARKWYMTSKLQETQVMATFVRELRTLSNLRHQHIVSLRGVVMEGAAASLLMEPTRSTLRQLLDSTTGCQSSTQIWPQFGCLASALRYIHKYGILHMDLKPENILIFQDAAHEHWKLSDFGSSRSLEDQSALDITPKYAPPEAFDGTPLHYSYDIWSLGCVFSEIILWTCGDAIADCWSLMRGYRFLFHEQATEVKNWLRAVEAQPALRMLGVESLHSVQKMLNYCPGSRPTTEDLCRTIRPSDCCRALANEPPSPSTTLNWTGTTACTDHTQTTMRDSALRDEHSGTRMAESSLTTSTPSDQKIVDAHPRYSDRLLDREIRLLLVVPCNDRIPLHFRLTTFSIDRTPTYSALSYVWGEPEPTVPLTVNDSVWRVGKNLGTALTYLGRSSEKSIYVWADALCINQNNVDERNQQVMLMREIYSGASVVMAWIDTEDDRQHVDLHEANLALRRILSGPVYSQVTFSSRQGRTPIVKTSTDGFAPPQGLLELGLSSLSRIAGSRFFSRVWVVQELALARDKVMFFGASDIKWADFAKDAYSMQEYLVDSGVYPHGRLRHVQSVVEMLKAVEALGVNGVKEAPHGERFRLLELLMFFRRYNATDPRDKIYAITGLTTRDAGLKISLDYSCSVEDVYLATAAAIIANGELDILSACQPRGRYSRSLPSWVPDWSAKSDVRIGLLFYSAAANYVRAEQDSSDSKVLCNCNRHLRVSGIIVDVVKKTLDDLKRMSITRYLRRLRDLLSNASIKERYGEGPGEALCRTTIGNQMPREYHGWRRAEYSDVEALMEALTISVTHMSVKIPDPVQRTFEIFQASKTLFYTSQGYIGLGPDDIRTGDFVVVLSGARIPHILRKWHGGQEGRRYNLVGDAYVHGIMDGEAVLSNPDWDELTIW